MPIVFVIINAFIQTTKDILFPKGAKSDRKPDNFNP